jgi:hypothetical protein
VRAVEVDDAEAARRLAALQREPEMVGDEVFKGVDARRPAVASGS